MAEEASRARRRTPGTREKAVQVAAPRSSADEDFLAELGARVRRIRALRGMSRKVLAEASDISERYIAQLESGMGNVSVLLLRRVAKAAGVTIDDLVSDLSPDMAWFRDRLRTAPPEALQRAKAILSGERQ